jgi:hypothetical protein
LPLLKGITRLCMTSPLSCSSSSDTNSVKNQDLLSVMSLCHRLFL